MRSSGEEGSSSSGRGNESDLTGLGGVGVGDANERSSTSLIAHVKSADRVEGREWRAYEDGVGRTVLSSNELEGALSGSGVAVVGSAETIEDGLLSDRVSETGKGSLLKTNHEIRRVRSRLGRRRRTVQYDPIPPQVSDAVVVKVVSVQ